MSTIRDSVPANVREVLTEQTPNALAVLGMARVASRARTASGRLSRQRWALQARVSVTMADLDTRDPWQVTS